MIQMRIPVLSNHVRPASLKALLLTIGSLIVLSAGQAMAVTKWNWSFQTNVPGQSGQGTFTTNDATLTVGTTYTITDIGGSYTRNGITYAITGLSNYQGATNTFQWGGYSSPIITNYLGISFIADSGDNVNIYFNDVSQDAAIYSGVDETVTEFIGDPDGLITFSSLTPAVPGPLPLFGAAAAFGVSRRLRRRVKHQALAPLS